jgi:hypothetical protein
MPAARAVARKFMTHSAKSCWSATSSVLASVGRVLMVEGACDGGTVDGAVAQPARVATANVMEATQGRHGSEEADVCMRLHFRLRADQRRCRGSSSSSPVRDSAKLSFAID